MATAAPSSALDAARWLADHHRRPFTEAALRARLPEGFDQEGAKGLGRALQEIGLKTRLVRRRVAEIDPGSLPVVLFKRDGTPLLLVGLDPEARLAATLDPSDGKTAELSLWRLGWRVRRQVLLVAPEEGYTSARLSPDAQAIETGQGHWLWSELGKHKGAWAQVALAALGANLAGLAIPIFVMNVFDRVIPNLAFVTLTTLVIGVVLALLLDVLLRLLRGAIIQRLSRRVDLSLAAQLFQRALRQRLLSRPGGSAGVIATLRDFDHVRDFFTSATLVSIIDMAFVGLFLWVLSLIVGPLAWVPVAAIPVILILALMAQIPTSRAARKAQQMSVKRNVVLLEAMNGLETVKSVGAEPVLQREWERAVAASSRVGAATRNWATFTSAATVLIQQMVTVGIISWGVFLASEGSITIGALVAANMLAGRILGPLAGVAQTIFRANFAFLSVRTISAFMTAEVEERSVLRSDLKVRKGRVELNEITFTYPGAQRPALSGVSLKIAPGSSTALLGRIGSGKSTLGKLINGSYQAGTGLVLIDGHEIAQFEPAELRAGIGYLPQDPVLFTGTLRENLTMGATLARDADVDRALYLAGIDGFVATLPEGLNFFAGERGERLSGGQRQSIALARLLLRKPKMLFLDEPTNAMDHQTEALVIERFKELQAEGVGLILSTHRMSLANIAERFIVLDQGQKVMDGPRAEVMQKLTGGPG